MNEKSITVIGAVIAGLSAGCYGQMNGYRTQIFEMQDKPGGCCTTWNREGYKIEGSLHWLTGSGPGNSFYSLWEELGALQGRTIVDHDEYTRIEGREGASPGLTCAGVGVAEGNLAMGQPEDMFVTDGHPGLQFDS